MALDFATLMSTVSYASAKEVLVSILRAAELAVDDWVAGEPSHQWVEIFTNALVASSGANNLAARSNFLDLATDPGDVDSDGVQRPTFGPKWLSNKGSNDYGTERIGDEFATGFATLTNTGSTPYTFAPLDLTLQSSVPASDGAQKTFRNDDDPTIYTGPGGTFTLVGGATQVVPVIADEAGSLSTAGAGDISILVTTLPGVTVTNAASVIGIDQEAADDYRSRCREATAIVSPGGPGDAYRYLATTLPGGKPLLRADGVTPVAITRVFVSASSSTGVVTAYYASASGGAVSDDVTAANTNIEQNAVPDCVTFTGLSATGQAVDITYAVRARAGAGVSSGSIQAAIQAALDAYFLALPIGGFDQTAGAGTLYASELAAVVGQAHPNIFKVVLTLPSGDVALALGHVATRGTIIPGVVLV